MISVEEARAALFALIAPMPAEEVSLREAHGRVLAAPLRAARAQPPFAASSMDGYALRRADQKAGARLSVIGEAAAGHGFAGQIGPGEAVRIFTGAPIPAGADCVEIQEHVSRSSSEITLNEISAEAYIRPAGADFAQGFELSAPRRLAPEDIALIAAMNHAEVSVHRRPRIALIATGDELVPPGGSPGPDQIIASNNYGLAALLEADGARVSLLPIAADNREDLRAVLALAEGADLIITIGGASVGDHDLIAQLGAEAGLERAFYKIAMRPGKPLIAGRLFGAPMIGLPGNPVSAMVCGHVFLRPVLAALQGLPAAAPARLEMPLGAPLPANGPRAHYMRAERRNGRVYPFERQDSALLSLLSRADCLAIRPPHDGPRTAGDLISLLPIA